MKIKEINRLNGNGCERVIVKMVKIFKIKKADGIGIN